MGTHSNKPEEGPFQRRKLNHCMVSGCKDQHLRMLECLDGVGVKFICKSHSWLLAQMEKDVAKIYKKIGR